MSFTDNIGKTWDAIKRGTNNGLASIGAAWDSASDSAVGKTIGDVADALGLDTAAGIAGKGLEGLEWAYDKYSRGASTLALTGMEQQRFGYGGFDPRGLLDRRVWEASWDRSEDVSVGQAVNINAGNTGQYTRDQLLRDPKARQDWFHDSWQGQLSSGAFDLLFNIAADPFAIGGKFVAGARRARTTLGAGQSAEAMAVARGEQVAGSRRVDRSAGRINDFVDWTDGKSAAQIAEHPAMKANRERGTLSYLLSQAGDTETKRDLFGTILGDEVSRGNLAGRNSRLFDELETVTKKPDVSVFAERFNWADGGAAALEAVQGDLDSLLSKYQDDVVRQMERQQRILNAVGTSNVVSGTAMQTALANRRVDRLAMTSIPLGLGSRMAHVITGNAAARLEGHINLTDPAQGYEQLRDTLNQARYLTGKQRNTLLSQFSAATNKGERGTVAMRAEMEIVSSVAKRYDITSEQAQAFITEGSKRRNAHVKAMRSRIYTTAVGDDIGIVAFNDPDTGIHITQRPLAISQLEDHFSMIDPRGVDKVLRSGTNRRWLELAATRVAGQRGREGMTRLYDTYDPLAQVVSDGMMAMTKVWKDATLLVRAPAYMTRVQIDTQARLMARMGALAYGAQLPRTIADYTKFMAGSRDRFLRPLPPEVMRERFATRISEATGLKGEALDVAVNTVIADRGSMGGLVDELSNRALQEYRATGDWVPVAPGASNWRESYFKAVRQIRNSPVMMASLRYDRDALRQLVAADPKIKNEWMAVRDKWDDMDEWLDTVVAHTDNLAPTPELRAHIGDLALPFNYREVDQYFGGDKWAQQMTIHGPALAPNGESGISEWYRKARERAYRIVADAPENHLGRLPLYEFEFKNALREITDNISKDVLTEKDLGMARVQADRLARKRIGQTLFDASHTSNLAHGMRIVMPFFSAWEDMIRKWGGLFYDNPAMAERMRLAWDAPNNAGLVVDENGNRVDAQGRAIDPKTGLEVTDKALKGEREMIRIPAKWLPKGLRERTGAGGMVFDKGSLNIIFQGDPWWLPGFGPIAQVPVNELLLRAFPDHADNPIAKWVLPLGTSDEDPALIAAPAWARQLRNVMDADATDVKEIGARLLKSETIKWQQGMANGTMTEADAPTLDKVGRMTKNYFLLRLFTSLTAPVAVRPEPEMQFYVDQARKLRQQYGDVQKTPEYQQALKDYTEQWGGETAKERLLIDRPEFKDWQTRMLEEYPDYFTLAISASESESGLTMTNNAVSAARRYRRALAAAPEYGDAIVGPDNGYGLAEGQEYDPDARNWLLRNSATPGGKKLRGVMDPATALKVAEARKGWAEYQKARTNVAIQMENDGVTSFNSNVGREYSEMLRLAREDIFARNSAWQEDYNSRDSGTSVNFLNAMNRAIIASPSLAKRPDMLAVGKYVASRDVARQALAEVGARSLTNEAAEGIREDWNILIAELIQSSPGFEQLYYRYLENDDLSQGIFDAGPRRPEPGV